jgi:hypothetical protein
MSWHSNTKNYSVSKDVVFKETLNALNTLKIKTEKSDEPNGIIEAKVGASLLTWGHWIKISITPSKEGSSVYVESRAKQLVSYGKDEENVNKIFAELDRRIPSIGYVPAASPSTLPSPSPTPPPPPPPLAPVAQMCPTCRKPLTFIQQYGRWYCYNCKKYP